MHVLVAGAHGQVGQHLTRVLAAGDHDVRGMVRDDAQTGRIEELGARPVVADLTDSVDHAVEGCSAVIFAAGSGGEDVWGVDCEGAKRLMDAAESEALDRFVMLSSINADRPEESPEALREYLRAKAEADASLRERDLTHTIVRPGPLTNEAGTGRIRTGEHLDRRRIEIPREDVARTLAAALPMEQTFDLTFELASGEHPIQKALQQPLGEA